MNIVKVPIAKVVPWEHNPRGIKTKDFDRLKKQILKLGVYKPLLAYKENGHYVVLGGNMRIRALKELGIPEVEVSVVEAKTQAKKIEYALSDNDRAGFYEEDKLAELVYPEMAHLDLAEFKVDLGEPLDLKAVVERYGPDIDDGAGDIYSTKITIPTYEPKGEKPPESELVDRIKTEQLISEIDNAELPEEVARFLRYAAERHAIFNFGLIAEYYCHADPKVQDLMERSALVLIDFKKAIENGFVSMTERLGKIADREGFRAT